MGWERSNSGTSSHTQTFPGVLAEHVDQLQADGVAQRLRYFGHADRLVALYVWVNDRLAARLAGGALGFRCKFKFNSHAYKPIDLFDKCQWSGLG